MMILFRDAVKNMALCKNRNKSPEKYFCQNNADCRVLISQYWMPFFFSFINRGYDVIDFTKIKSN